MLNIPLALAASRIALWLHGTNRQPNDARRPGAQRSAFLVDEATVEIENIHTQMRAHATASLGPCASATP